MLIFLSFPRKASPDCGAGDTAGTEPRARLQEERAAASLNDEFLSDSVVKPLFESVLRLDFFFIFNDHLKGTSNFHCEQSQVFRMFIHMIKARKILLIGKLKGYSILAIAEELPDDGKIFACAEAPYLGVNSQEAFDYSSDGKKISMRVGPMADTLETLHAEDEHFDIVFIDADQRNAVNYYSFVMDNHLLRMDAVICIENTLMKGQVYLENIVDENVLAVRKLNTVINSDPRVEQVSAMQLVKVPVVLYLWILQSTL
uniref:Caffeoyl-CoA O-methyltransferase n=1 Tax=Falco tinnunculus TaxID=100819 RepID=A0A8C4URM7_FALTI